MTREERIRKALAGDEVDRVPCNVWMHLSEVDQDPRSLAEAMAAYNEEYDFDFIKMMPFGAYSTQDWGAKIKIYCDCYKEPVIVESGIRDVRDYTCIEPLSATYGTWGKTLQVAQHLSKVVAANTPFLQTIFSPATTLKKLAGNRLLADMMEHPLEVHQALRAITETTVNFVKANIEAGVSGFFFATQTATYDYMTDLMYAEFCKPYDLEVLDTYKDQTWFNVIHIHGSNIMFDTVSQYPCNCLNWHDRDTAPDMKTARETVCKTFLGGIQEVPNIINGVLDYDSFLRRSTPDQVTTHVQEAIAMVDGRGLIIGPGCVCDPKTTKENLHAVRKAVERQPVLSQS
ncbi:uroporphyrinogen decarboxylase family protein [Oscillospiraceae bacterium MB08-C2-2]|nr:uroporphyrinogen decarboxylase family protein [Oscillospiraceae bacterium MB08-C2-2]